MSGRPWHLLILLAIFLVVVDAVGHIPTMLAGVPG
jgi:hypothetical protein